MSSIINILYEFLSIVLCIIDEYVSFINNVGDRKLSQEVSNGISNLLRRGRHAKIHMVLSTQDPTIKNMKVDIGNITSRMAFACAKYHNSITIIGEGGAEKLFGKGAMLYKSNENPNPLYLQGAFMPTNEVKHIIERIVSASHNVRTKYVIPDLSTVQISIPTGLTESDKAPNENGDKKELAEIIMWALGRNTISANQMQEKFRMGNRAYDVLEKLFCLNLITGKFHNQPRTVLPKCVEDIPSEIVEFLLANGVIIDEIETIIKTRVSKLRVL